MPLIVLIQIGLLSLFFVLDFLYTDLIVYTIFIAQTRKVTSVIKKWWLKIMEWDFYLTYQR